MATTIFLKFRGRQTNTLVHILLWDMQPLLNFIRLNPTLEMEKHRNMKLDITKAFDTIRWDFIIDTLQAMGLPELFISWICSCIFHGFILGLCKWGTSGLLDWQNMIQISSCSSKMLSFAGRLQLINSNITSITNLWCSAFRILKICFETIESMCGAFLCPCSPHITSKTKVAWDEAVCPKKEGSLGIRRMYDSSRVFSLQLI